MSLSEIFQNCSRSFLAYAGTAIGFLYSVVLLIRESAVTEGLLWIIGLYSFGAFLHFSIFYMPVLSYRGIVAQGVFKKIAGLFGFAVLGLMALGVWNIYTTIKEEELAAQSEAIQKKIAPTATPSPRKYPDSKITAKAAPYKKGSIKVPLDKVNKRVCVNNCQIPITQNKYSLPTESYRRMIFATCGQMESVCRDKFSVTW